MNKYIALLLSVVAVVGAANEVPVTIYYESLCADSIKFFTEQFIGVWQKLNSHMNLNLVPFGKSSRINDTAWNCHHGAVECVGNKIQACLVNDPNIQINTKVDFIDCLLKKSSSATLEPDYINNARTCGSNIKTINGIIDCRNNNQGIETLKIYEEKTVNLKPQLTSVPTIVFHDAYNAEDSKLATTNFGKALCKHMTAPVPKECDAYNGAIGTTASLITVLTAFFAMYHM